MVDFADDLLKGERSGKYTPIDVASWLEEYAAATSAALARAATRATDKASPAHRRLTVDVATAADLGRFFAAKMRAGVLYHLFDKTSDRAAIEAAVSSYRSARDAWSSIVGRTKNVYQPDITVGETRVLRGHWADRLSDIDADIAAVTAKLSSAKPTTGSSPIATAIAEVIGKPSRPSVSGRHAPASTYLEGRSLPLEFAADAPCESVRLHYRIVNQAERWQSAAMQNRAERWHAEIPATYTHSPYPLQYYFEVKTGPALAALYPGLGPQRTDQPYFVVRRGQNG
jgi:hypothetical protein